MSVQKNMTFGKFIESKRKECVDHPSLRAAAAAIGVSPQFYSEVEKDRKSAFTADKLDSLRVFLKLSDEDSNTMYEKAAESKKRGGAAVPQDLPEYIVEHDYVMAALRTAKSLNAGEEEWMEFVKRLEEKEGKRAYG